MSGAARPARVRGRNRARDHLLRAVRAVVRADSDPARQTLFATLMHAHPAVRVTYALHQRLGGTWGSTVLVAGYALACFLAIAPARRRGARVLAVARHANAQRQVARIAGWIGTDECARVRTGLQALAAGSAISAAALLLARPRASRVVRIIRRLDGKHGFLVSCRAAAALAWYSRCTRLLQESHARAVLVSSDSNPEEVGFVAAARALDIPQVFVAHAYPTPLTPPLDFTLSILEGEAAIEGRSRKGPIRGAVLLAGVEGESAPLDPRRISRPRPVVGIFTSKAVSWPVLATIIDDCRAHLDAREVVIRWHPSMLERPRLGRLLADLSRVVESPPACPLADVARRCDWVIADVNSNVHLPVLKLGVPTVAVKGLGVYPDSRFDQYGFVANRIIFPPVESVRDVCPDAVVAFFSDGWATRFERYDASYLRPDSAIREEVRRAVRSLLDDAGVLASV